jgi:hypothetical protein
MSAGETLWLALSLGWRLRSLRRVPLSSQEKCGGILVPTVIHAHTRAEVLYDALLRSNSARCGACISSQRVRLAYTRVVYKISRKKLLTLSSRHWLGFWITLFASFLPGTSMSSTGHLQ